jgi:hypothetical protein
MVHVSSAVLAVALSWVADGAAPDGKQMAAYRAATSKAGRDAQDHLRLSFWCEAHDLTREREAELAETLRLSPNHEGAHGALGQVRYSRRWLTPEQVAREMEEPEKRALFREYDELRDQAGDGVEADLKLASWCSSKGLRVESIAHLTAVIRRDPSHAEAWRRLGYQFREGRWVHPSEEVVERRLHSEARERYRTWHSRLSRLARELADPEKSAAARAELDTIKDVAAVPAIWDVFGHGSIESRQFTASMLGRIEGPESSSRLAALALLDLEGPVRGSAIGSLSTRDPREYIGPVIGYIQKPATLTIKPLGGPGEPGQIVADGMPARTYVIPTLEEFRVGTGHPPAPIDPMMLASIVGQMPSSGYRPAYNYSVTYHPNDPAVTQAFAQLSRAPGNAQAILQGLSSIAAGHASPAPLTYQIHVPEQYYFTRGNQRPGNIAREIRNSERAIRNAYRDYTASVRQQFKADVKTLRDHNALVERTTRSAIDLLESVTGLRLGTEQSAWAGWWKAWNESEPPLGDLAPANRNVPDEALAAAAKASTADLKCKLHRPRFAAETIVWTARGKKTIDSLRVGDLVLAQDPQTGSLSFQGIVAVTSPVPDAMLRIRLEGGVPLSLTPTERVWKADLGWVPAGSLQPDDRMRVLGGRARVLSIEKVDDEPAMNVILSGEATLFAGDRGLLAHDNGIVHPLSLPFDRVPDLH